MAEGGGMLSLAIVYFKNYSILGHLTSFNQ